mgnify:CR=1 FL=1
MPHPTFVLVKHFVLYYTKPKVRKAANVVRHKKKCYNYQVDHNLTNIYMSDPQKPESPVVAWEALPPIKKPDAPVVTWEHGQAPVDSQADATAKKAGEVVFEPLTLPEVAKPVVQWVGGVEEKKDK